MLKLTENDMEMYVCKVFDEKPNGTRVHAWCLWKCQSE